MDEALELFYLQQMLAQDSEFQQKMQVAQSTTNMNAFVFGLKLSFAYAWAVFPLALVVLFAFIPFAWPLIPGLIIAATAPAVKLFNDYNNQSQTKEEPKPWTE